MEKIFKIKSFSLNNHSVRAIVPSRTISIEEGIKKARKILSK